MIELQIIWIVGRLNLVCVNYKSMNVLIQFQLHNENERKLILRFWKEDQPYQVWIIFIQNLSKILMPSLKGKEINFETFSIQICGVLWKWTYCHILVTIEMERKLAKYCWARWNCIVVQYRLHYSAKGFFVFVFYYYKLTCWL